MIYIQFLWNFGCTKMKVKIVISKTIFFHFFSMSTMVSHILDHVHFHSDVKVTDLIKIKAMIGLLYLSIAWHLNIFGTKEIFFHESSYKMFATTMSCNHFFFLILYRELDDKKTWSQWWREDKIAVIRSFFMKMNGRTKDIGIDYHMLIWTRHCFLTVGE